MAVKGCGRTLSPPLVFTFFLLSAFLSFLYTALISVFEIEVWLIYTVMLVSGKQQSDSWHIPFVLLPYRLLQNIEDHSLKHTAGPYVYHFI